VSKRGFILLAICAVLLGAPGQIQFEEIAKKAGLRFELHNGATGRLHQIELMLGGVAALTTTAAPTSISRTALRSPRL